jgi:hypothetical protein
MEPGGRLSFLGRPLPPDFELLVITIAPGQVRPFEPAEWRDGIVVVERGAVTLEAARGGRLRCARGAVLALAGLPLLALHNPGRETAVLTVVRRRGDEFPPARASDENGR